MSYNTNDCPWHERGRSDKVSFFRPLDKEAVQGVFNQGRALIHALHISLPPSLVKENSRSYRDIQTFDHTLHRNKYVPIKFWNKLWAEAAVFVAQDNSCWPCQVQGVDGHGLWAECSTKHSHRLSVEMAKKVLRSGMLVQIDPFSG